MLAIGNTVSKNVAVADRSTLHDERSRCYIHAKINYIQVQDKMHSRHLAIDIGTADPRQSWRPTSSLRG